MDWWVKFNTITSIRAIQEVPNDSIFYGCGDYLANEASDPSDLAVDAIYQARIFKMQADSTVKWMMNIAGTNPVSTKKNQDRCYGLSVDSNSGDVTALLQIKMKELRDSSLSYGNFYDTVLLRISSTGKVNYGV